MLSAGASLKQQALDFISHYILEHGRSPAMRQIALVLAFSDKRAKALVKKLAFEKMIERGRRAARGTSPA
ncbi:hypothetical protein C8J47_2012 [Sphingomonas sp. PP-F2F-G114-C0414]|uniref:hypothetical protein n=1 Tax=Sphingomonas sp. PP-F2F-G114-C0414 TaxID=2135662 RepID=UPI000F2915A1|nr:hypothetical protein [Sphingomonas sp. PP-F2F-G114-C0414]RMB34291.1 hypothetical protein C8J47_2012 [Sphingomonas sp. PP-F2F-G114-C0414]